MWPLTQLLTVLALVRYTSAVVDTDVGSYDTEPGPVVFAESMRIATVSVCSLMVMLAIATAITFFWFPKAWPQQLS
ncbi:hypothetical protein V1264_009056 [Littorina saxatilis]|uniref:Uncharacterized protein n=1 Tax=Littorina saxatilis TaxID=31220 RepID=A0AAN9AQL9_9CAEN